MTDNTAPTLLPASENPTTEFTYSAYRYQDAPAPTGEQLATLRGLIGPVLTADDDTDESAVGERAA